MSHLFVNCNPELELFHKMLHRNTKARILLIEAETGMGKSTLLGEFERQCSTNTKHLKVNFEQLLGVSEVIHQFRSELGLAEDDI